MPVSDVSALIQNRVQTLRSYHQDTGLERAELDLSGGIDSAVMAGLLVLALGLCAFYAFVRRRRKAAAGNPPYGRLDDRWLARRQARE